MSHFIIDSFKNEEDFLISLIIMGAIFFGIALIVGVILCILFILILIGLLSAGIISASILVGYHQKSVSKGFKTFFLALSISGSSIISVLFFFFVNSIKEWWSTNTAIVAGVLCGLISGYLLGLIMFEATKKIVTFSYKKFQSTKTKYLN